MSTVSRGSLAAAITLALGVSHAHATNFDVTNTNDSGAGSFRQALIDAAADSNIPHTINLSAIAGQTIDISSRLLMAPDQDMDLSIVGSDVTVAGDGSSGVIQFGGGQMQLGIGIYPDLDVSISDLTISGGDSSEPGGGIFFDGFSKYQPNSLTLNNVTVTGNTSENVGGGIAMYSGTLNLIDSTVTSNIASVGGGVFHSGGELFISNSSISNNTAVAASPASERFELVQRFSHRGGGGSDGTGAGIFSINTYGTTITDSTISGNDSLGDFGGAVLLTETDLSVQRSTFSNNSAAGSIGGAYAVSYDGSVNFEATTISDNRADAAVGGAVVFSESGLARMENCTVSGNSAASEVGGLIVGGFYFSPEISFSTIVGNSVDSGTGGLILLGPGGGRLNENRGVSIDPTVNTSIIAGNLSDGGPSDLGSGGAIFVDDEDLAGFPLMARARQDRGFGFGTIINVNYTLLGSISLNLELDAVSEDLLSQNPILGPLANNGGPTLTHLPGAASPALNVVPVGTLGCGTSVTEDQRGEARPQDTACTAGSVDTQGVLLPPPPPLPPALAVPVSNTIGMMLLGGLLGLAGILGLRRRRCPLS